METPQNERQLRPVRQPTPRLSERKKSLFPASTAGPPADDDDNILIGMNAIDPSLDESQQQTQRITRQSVGYALSGAKAPSPSVTNIHDTTEVRPPSTRRSSRLDPKNATTCSRDIGHGNGKENIPFHTIVDESSEEQLPQLFSNSMKLCAQDSKSKTTSDYALRDEVSTMDIEQGADLKNAEGRLTIKRHHESCTSPQLDSRKQKVSKIAPSKVESLSFSTKSFYSSDAKTFTGGGRSTSMYSTQGSVKLQMPRNRRSHGRSNSINKSVHHKIRRRPLPSRHSSSIDVDLILSNLRNEKLRSLIQAQRAEKMQIEKVHSIFRAARNPIEMARPLTSLGFSDDSNNNKVDYKQTIREADFSDIDLSESEPSGDDRKVGETEEVIPLILHNQIKVVEGTVAPGANRKFFKSGPANRSRKEITITPNIRASVCNGKISLMAHKNQRSNKRRPKPIVNNSFSDEQATVDEILKNLNDTAFGDITPKPTANEQVDESNSNDKELEADTELNFELLNEFKDQKFTDYSDFRKRLPYNTSNPEIIERQHLLLDFLISNGICNEQNFIIFIAEPDSHKAEASRIVDELVMVVNGSSEFRQRIPYNTSDPELIEQQHLLLNFLVEHNIHTEDNFDIFIVNNESRHAEAEAIVASIQAQEPSGCQPTATVAPDSELLKPAVLVDEDDVPCCSSKAPMAAFEKHRPPAKIVQSTQKAATETTDQGEKSKLYPIFYAERCQPLLKETSRRPIQRIWTGGRGADQLQIDAGQKQFGAHQCQQCGLMYTVHEPEEERLHRDFHASLHVLRFKGWIDEDLVAIYNEWGPDGRILRLTECAPVKRRERLLDILKIVDKELGFSSYILPTTFVAFFAVRKSQIVGVCLVQPLTKANRYLIMNGDEYCTQEEFPARCGISRIWVSPLHRRLHIGTKLMRAVQSSTVLSEEIPLHEIAFSAPTELGKLFVQSITKTEHFMVYQ